MSFDPLDLLKIVQEVKGAGSTEAHYRSVSNRAYYGIFGYLRNRLVAEGRLPYSEEASIHRKVITSLKTSHSITEQKIGGKLEFLLAERNKADYNHKVRILDWHSKNILQYSETIMQLIRQLDSEASGN